MKWFHHEPKVLNLHLESCTIEKYNMLIYLFVYLVKKLTPFFVEMGLVFFMNPNIWSVFTSSRPFCLLGQRPILSTSKCLLNYKAWFLTKNSLRPIGLGWLLDQTNFWVYTKKKIKILGFTWAFKQQLRPKKNAYNGNLKSLLMICWALRHILRRPISITKKIKNRD